MRYAGFFVRLCAFCIDYIIFQILMALGLYLVLSQYSLEKPDFFIIGVGLVIVLEGITYYIWNNIYLIMRTRQTIGKKVFNIYIENNSVYPLRINEILLREMIMKPISILCFGYGCIRIMWDREKKGWHDIISRTVVMYL